MTSTPGTVSKILWHFTGGPRWDTATNCQEDAPKTAEEAYATLLKILSSSELRIGNYREVIHFETMWYQTLGPGSIQIDSTRTLPEIIESSQVTCLADIPIIHLNYHAKRYGKVAIGFHRESIIKHGFSPVLYQLTGASVLETIHHIFDMARFLQRVRKSENDEYRASDPSWQDKIGYSRDASGNWVPAKRRWRACQ